MSNPIKYFFFAYIFAYYSSVFALTNSTLDQSKEPPYQLHLYEGNFKDSDGDGMTDLAEIKYGYDPTDPDSFPKIDFIAPPVEEFPILHSADNDARMIKTEKGIRILWDNHNPDSEYAKFSLTLGNGESQLYYGGHDWEKAEVSYEEFQLQGDEILKGRFSESDPDTGQWVKDYEWFEINLSDYPLPPTDTTLGDENDKISFRFNGFSEQQIDQYTNFMSKVIPIIKNILGNPAETFTCDFKIDNESWNSWVTLDQGRTISLDDSWIPRLLVHEMIHMWKGKYAFSYSADNWAYADDLSGFEEIAEGLSYEILHDFVEAFPYDENTRLILDGGPWWNWSSGAANFDVIKHQKYTGAGTFWSGEALFENDRYSIAAMVIQTILRHDPEFMKNTLRKFYDLIENDPSFRPTRSNILDLWASQIPEINGIDSRTYLEAIPIFNGQKLAQQYYPVIYQNETNSYSTTKTIFGSYAVDGYMWWNWVRPENIADFKIPEWVKYNLDEDGYYYIDSNNQPYEVITRNIFGEVKSHLKGVLDAGYQNEEKTVPNNLFSERIEALDSSKLPQGLYMETLTFSNLTEYTSNATETFYSFGYENFHQSEDEYSLFVGVDSKFGEEINISLNGKTFSATLVDGCAIIKTSEIAHNEQGILLISVHSHEKTYNYKRALNNAGSSDGVRHQQFLIIDRDFDGTEDLYDRDINQTAIEIAYQEYKKNYPEEPKQTSSFTVEVSSTTGGSFEITGLSNDKKAEAGSNITIRAIAELGYEFEKWSGDFQSTEQKVIITVTSDISINAHFRKIEPMQTSSFTVEVSSTTGGSFEITGLSNDKKAEAGSNITIRAIAELGYEFEKWSGDFQSTEQKVIITVTSDISINAHFRKIENISLFVQAGDKLENGWRSISWFGYCLPTNSGWLFHPSHGWLFSTSKNPNSIWYWDNDLGWCWTNANLYPYIYSAQSGWLYYRTKTKSPNRWFYNFAQRSWITL